MNQTLLRIGILSFICWMSLLMDLGAGCGRDVGIGEKGKNTMPLRDINQVMESHTKELMSLQGVVGVYVGQLDSGASCIGVMVMKKTPELEQKIPKTLEGYPVKIDETGEIKPMK